MKQFQSAVWGHGKLEYLFRVGIVAFIDHRVPVSTNKSWPSGLTELFA